MVDGAEAMGKMGIIKQEQEGYQLLFEDEKLAGTDSRYLKYHNFVVSSVPATPPWRVAGTLGSLSS
jgi:hypothetical protein